MIYLLRQIIYMLSRFQKQCIYQCIFLWCVCSGTSSQWLQLFYLVVNLGFIWLLEVQFDLVWTCNSMNGLVSLERKLSLCSIVQKLWDTNQTNVHYNRDQRWGLTDLPIVNVNDLLFCPIHMNIYNLGVGISTVFKFSNR